MSSYVKINLLEYFNHRIIDDNIINNSENKLDNVSISGQFFKPDLLPNSLEEVCVDKIPYMFPDKSPGKYDNIVCEEQLIYVPKGYYKGINILGLSEWGDNKDSIRVIFSNNNSEEVDIFFLDWGKAGSNWDYDSELNKKSILAFKSEITSSWMCAIYYNKCRIENSSKVMTSIKLPYNPNIHIFAVTLEKN